MTMSATTRLENHRTALALLLQELGDHAIDVKVVPPAVPVFSSVRRTTWESLERDGYVTSVASLGTGSRPRDGSWHSKPPASRAIRIPEATR